jgi:hypothetical protein
MTQLYRRLLAAPLFVGMSFASFAYADAPPDTQEWFRGQNQTIAPNRAANLAGQGGADFGGGPATPPPPLPPAHGHRGQPASDFPDDQVHDWVVANARYAYSRATFHRAEKELDSAVRGAQFTFEQSKEYGDAVAAEKQAYDAYVAERVKALQSVVTDPKYIAALELRDETGNKLKRLRAMNKGELPREVLVAMASLKLQYANDAHVMEAAALEKDDALKDARRKMVEAGARVTALRNNFDASIRTNPQVLMARRNLEDSRVALITAEAYLNGATVAGAIATDYSYYRHRWDGLAAPQFGYGWTGYGY